jgi:hypothetical protein
MLIVRKVPNGRSEIIVDATNRLRSGSIRSRPVLRPLCECPSPDILRVDGSSSRVLPTDSNYVYSLLYRITVTSGQLP